MFGIMIVAGQKFYVVRSPIPYMTLRLRSQTSNFCIAIFLQFQPSKDFIHLWHDGRALSKILHSTIPIPEHGLKVKVTDFEFFCVQFLQCQFLQSL